MGRYSVRVSKLLRLIFINFSKPHLKNIEVIIAYDLIEEAGTKLFDMKVTSFQLIYNAVLAATFGGQFGVQRKRNRCW